jgi:crotonobetainyl-CoA:carnitine CoA-transferase CaiB-like acyl-CoA transferase
VKTLSGVRIVSLAVNVPGPVAAAILRDMGASVTKVEPPAGDPLATMCRAWYAELVREMNVLTLDLKADAGRQQLGDLLSMADVLITSSRPGALDRLGLEKSELRLRYPHLSHVSIVGYASQPDIAGHDLTYQAREGLLDPPALPKTLVSDLAGAQQTVIATLALLVARGPKSGGGRLEVSLSDAAATFAAPLRHGLTAPGALLGGGFAGYGLYPAREGWIALATLEPHFRAGIERELGVSPSDRGAMEDVFATRTAAEWEAWAEEHDLPIAEVRGSVLRGSAGRGR